MTSEKSVDKPSVILRKYSSTGEDSSPDASPATSRAHRSRRRSGTVIIGKRRKVALIQKCLKADPVDISNLRQLAISRDGLVNDEIRRIVWPKLLDVDTSNIPAKPDTEILHSHRDYNQVVMDVNRSLKRFPPGMEEEKRMSMQDQLVDVIMRVLVNRDELHYYQGYHDICVTFLLVVGEDLTFALVDKLSTLHLRDFMDENLDRTRHMLNYLYPIIGKANPELCEFMERSETGTIFCLSWLITWYGHVLNDFRHIVRFYDFFIACHPLMPIYLAAAIVLHREKEILATECEMCYVHSLLSKIPDDLPFEHLVSKAGDLYLQYPPKELANEAVMTFRKSAALLNAAKQNYLKKKKLAARPPAERSILMRVTIWTLSAVISAAAFAMFNSMAKWDWFS